MVKFCFKKSLEFVFLLTLSATSLLASPSGTEDEDFRSIHSARHIEDLPDELQVVIFSFLTPKDVPSVTRVSSRWQRLMDDNYLWKEYARRAQILLKEDLISERSYKAFVREHCTFSFTDLGFLNGGSGSLARGISADGSVIVGDANDGAEHNHRRAFRWTSEKGMESLGTLNEGSESSAWGISADGSVIVGNAYDGAAKNQLSAFRWASEKGLESLGTLNGGRESRAWGINAEGLVIVGQASDEDAQNQLKAIRWTSKKGMESLGTLNGGTSSYACGISAEGSVIVGTADDGDPYRAFRWTAEKGMESVEKMLTDKGLLPPQWRLTKVNAITPTGTVLIGEGKYNDGSTKTLTRAWRAVIPRTNLF